MAGTLHLSLMVLFSLASCLMITSGHPLANSNSSLGAGGVSGDTIVSDLQSGHRGIFAAGYVSGKLTLLVSGPGDHKNPTGGFQVTVEEADDGVFQITTIPVPVPSGIPGDADVKFICKDSSGANLVAVSRSEVGAVLLPSGHYEKTAVKKSDSGCYQDGSLHLSSSEAGYFYAVASGSISYQKYFFIDQTSIKTSTQCNGDPVLGQLCINDDRIFIESKCGASVPTGIISGSVGPQNAYLFDGSNTVYSFDSSVFTSKKSSKLIKRTKEEAFVRSDKPNTATALPDEVSTTPDYFLFFSIGCISFTLICGFGSSYYSFCVVHPEMRRKRRERGRAILAKILDGWEYIDGEKWGLFYGVPKTEEEWNNVPSIYKDQFPDMRRRMEQKEAKEAKAEAKAEAKKQKTKQRKATTDRSRSRSRNRNSSAGGGGKSKGGKSASKSRNRSSSPGSKKRA